MVLKHASSDPAELLTRLIGLITELLGELHPQTPAPVIDQASLLVRDLGLDSLSRVELMSRIECDFELTLPEAAFVEAESVADLLRMISAGDHAAVESPLIEAASTLVRGVAAGPPRQAQTLIEVLEYYAQATPERVHIRILDEHLQDTPITYADLRQQAGELAYGLVELGIERGARVAIMLPTGHEYFLSFFGILLAGAVPVPIYPPARISQLEDHLRRHCAILNNCSAQIMITLPEAVTISQLLRANTPSLRHVCTMRDLRRGHHIIPGRRPGASDLAFLQYTSGSTGNPKGVMLTHANLLANISALGLAIQAGTDDVFVSWLPLYHDMGLIGAWLGSMFHAIPLVIMPPPQFLVRPQRWLWAIHKFHGTLSAAPNFAYELCLRRIAARDIEGLDLSSWRIAFNGAEPVSATTIASFTERFGKYGFQPGTMAPVYGLAEAAVGLSVPPLGRIPLIDAIDRAHFARTGMAIATEAEDPQPLRFAACGQPLPGHEIRIVDGNGRELPERHQGSIQFRGPSATQGYFRNPGATANLIKEDWLEPGDLGYMAGGDIYITGRSKDIIIRAGRNIYPHELEQAISALPGVRQDRVAVFGSPDPASGTERLVVVAESRTLAGSAEEALRLRINELASALVGNPPDVIVLAPPGTVLKTSSGKVRRSACRDLYERNAIGSKPSPIWLQLLRLARSASIPWCRRKLQQAAELLRALGAWLGLVPLAGLALLLASIGSNCTRHRQWVGILARILARIAGVRLNVEGSENLPAQQVPAIYVCNHCSYIDSFVLLACLPALGSFVAKAELQRQPVLHYFLQRLGTRFIERYDSKRGVLDLDQLIEELRSGSSLIIFPEGTFSRSPGLRYFHMGAFVAAARANVPLVPLALRGTRSVLRDGTWLPRAGKVAICIGAAIDPGNAEHTDDKDVWRLAVRMRRAARQHILRHCDEPDLDSQR